MLIRDAEVWDVGPADVRLSGGMVAEIGRIVGSADDIVIDAGGGALLPGLHDHHIHLAGLAVRASSVWCGPPEIASPDELAERFRRPGKGWIRGIGYHESLMGLPGARELDRLVADRPLRMQHRSGRMWLLNSLALAELLDSAEPPAGLERDAASFTGRLFDEDQWLRAALRSLPPAFTAVSRELARYGISGLTDMSPGNDPAAARHFDSQIESGALLQQCWLAGTHSLADGTAEHWRLGPAKLHLHEAALPDLEEAEAFIAAAHRQGRAVAIHCVSEVELVFALAALEEAGAAKGDRIEHASVAPPGLIARIAALGVSVCAQAHFIEERGDRYLVDVETRHIGDLYRLRSFIKAGIPLAGGSDAPFGGSDPWAAMRAATSRTTREGQVVGAEEALTPEQALALYFAAPDDIARQRVVAIGQPADLCLLDRPWARARNRLDAGDVRATFVSGRLVHNRIDQSPGPGIAGAQTPAGKDQQRGALSTDPPA